MVCQNGETVCKKHFGVSSLDKKTPVCDNTVYRLASMTKPITAVAILSLIEKDLIMLDTTVKSILPQFENIPVVSTGGSMGGQSALVYCAYSKRTPVACVANCPVCDTVFHFTERPDLPRTLYSAV